MKRVISILICGGLAGLAGAATTALQAVDGGGAPAASADYSADQSIGGITGISTGAAPVATARHGYIGQLYAAAALTVIPETNEVDEGASQQLDGLVTFDDDTSLAVTGGEVTWDAAAFPLADVAADGMATATNVYEDTLATATGRYVDVAGSGSFWVRNTGTDDFGSYAGDGLPDDWQVDNFGIDNPDAGPTNNVDEDPLDNTGEWIANTDPRDGDSYFQIAAISNKDSNAEVWFDSSAERVYSLEKTTNLVFTNWQPVAGQTNLYGNDAMRSLVETNPAGPNHYRVWVRLPP